MDFFIQLLTDPIGFYNSHELLVAQMGINAILAISIFVTFYSGQLTLANAGFMAIGAYAGAILTQNFHAPFGLAILAGTILPAVFAVPLGLPVLRPRGTFCALF